MLRSSLGRLPRGLAAPAPLFSGALRAFATSPRRSDLLKDIEEQLTPRAAVEAKRKAMEAKYADKLKKRAERWVPLILDRPVR